MRSLGIIENQVFSESLAKQWFIINYIQIIINEFLLKGSIVPLNIGVYLWTSRI